MKIKKNLKNKPLVEAIFELRWNLQKQAPGIRIDPHYKILVGRLYDKVSREYPHHIQLPTANMPDEIAEYVVQHQFRKGKEQWPLIQVGPGLVTLNSTHDYTWLDFEERICNLIEALFETYPNSDTNLKINKLILRYIDAVDFDYENDNVFVFLKNKMKTEIGLYEELFKDTGVDSSPLHIDLRFSFPSRQPKGAVLLRFFRGMKTGENALFWETQMQSIGAHAPSDKNRIKLWVQDSHALMDDWFFKIIEGDLLRRFE